MKPDSHPSPWSRLRAWWSKRRELAALREEVEAREGLLWAVRNVDDIRLGAPEGMAVLVAKELAEWQARLAERKARR